jgi:hypothetical protein
MAFAPPFEPIEGASEIRCNEANVNILRSCRVLDWYQFAVTIDECASATLMATRRFRFAKPERVVSSPYSLTSRRCSTPPRDLSPSPIIRPASVESWSFSRD